MKPFVYSIAIAYRKIDLNNHNMTFSPNRAALLFRKIYFVSLSCELVIQLLINSDWHVKSHTWWATCVCVFLWRVCLSGRGGGPMSFSAQGPLGVLIQPWVDHNTTPTKRG